MRGAAQKAWLKRALKASTTPFKVLAIGGGWSCAENEEGGDSWGVYLTERTDLFDLVRDEGTDGVVYLSRSPHMAVPNRLPRPQQGGADITYYCYSPPWQLPDATPHNTPT